MWLLFTAVGVIVLGVIIFMLTGQNPEVIDEDASREVSEHPNMKVPHVRAGYDPSDERTGSERDMRDDGGTGILDV
jgi:hypothetical protein